MTTTVTTTKPTLEDLQEGFVREISEIAQGALVDLEDKGVSEDLRDKIKVQVLEGVQKEAGSLAEAIFPFLERFSNSRLSALSQSILQTTIQAIVVPEVPPPVTVTITEETTVVTSSVTSSLETTYQQGTTTAGGAILWKWNKIDISQFDSNILSSSDFVQITMSYRPLSDMELDPGILVSMTYSDPGGAAAIRIATSENLVLPARYLVKIRYGRQSTLQAGTGPWIHNNDWTTANHFGFGVVHAGTSRYFLLRAEGSASGGPPYTTFYPPFVLPNRADLVFPTPTNAVYPSMGMTVEYEVQVKNSAFPNPPCPMISFLHQGSKQTGRDSQGTRPDRGLTFNGFTGAPYAAQPLTGWQGQVCNSFGLCLRHRVVDGSPASSWGEGEVLINDIVIMKHWMDW